MQNLQVFQNSQFGDLEILTIEGKEWFPAIKVAEVLGYSNPRKAIRDHAKEKGVTIRSVLSNGGMQDKKFINEGNLYRLITKSKLPQAEQFEEWVFEHVLPTIRKTGTYQVPSDPMQALELMFEATKQTKEEIESVKADVIDLKDNQKLDAGEYGLVTKTIHQRVAYIRQIHGLPNSKEVNKPLYQNINNDVNTMAGIKTRTQLRQKHFNDVMEIITNWFPSQSTMYVIRQLEMDFEEGGK
ncbi:ORF6C domain-containing protein [Staphylococcus pseudintermedius]|uniref:Antirepressor protein n=2 Tax=root TaxID=1 RepID=A0A499SHT4_9CAUD|nr:BRO family protein [Staphylococcus pseudintermedius]YP_010081569.1 anti-repressor [Staphylococcus phage phiSP44-1]AZB66632.1 antirepressor protein [Staphylococcus phage phiSP44-1]EGQ1585877.1 phage repressor protein [Staphylococcus pseudintermedius]EGQ2812374.1 phage repressor protein [Staphylococcus pseudintermedius]EGQ3126353.1 phage repressor protein [Staphylococcus pseudintermedius]EGQ3366884.1 phage repressor protein [Staphylococcus pseudintermedius]